MAAQSPTDSILPQWKKAVKQPHNNGKAEEEKRPSVDKFTETTKWVKSARASHGMRYRALSNMFIYVFMFLKQLNLCSDRAWFYLQAYSGGSSASSREVEEYPGMEEGQRSTAQTQNAADGIKLYLWHLWPCERLLNFPWETVVLKHTRHPDFQFTSTQKYKATVASPAKSMSQVFLTTCVSVLWLQQIMNFVFHCLNLFS